MSPHVPASYGIVTPRELAAELTEDAKPTLVDVRETHELAVSALAYDHHIPLGEIADRMGELDAEADLVIYCRSGGRSAQAAALLAEAGFPRVRNLVTGINGWARDVDPEMPTY